MHLVEKISISFTAIYQVSCVDVAFGKTARHIIEVKDAHVACLLGSVIKNSAQECLKCEQPLKKLSD